jgi:hypothetical protein
MTKKKTSLTSDVSWNCKSTPGKTEYHYYKPTTEVTALETVGKVSIRK